MISMERRNIDSITFPFFSPLLLLFEALTSSLGTRSGTGPRLPSSQSGSTELTSEERRVRVGVGATGRSSRRSERVTRSEGRCQVPSGRRRGRSAC